MLRSPLVRTVSTGRDTMSSSNQGAPCDAHQSTANSGVVEGNSWGDRMRGMAPAYDPACATPWRGQMTTVRFTHSFSTG